MDIVIKEKKTAAFVQGASRGIGLAMVREILEADKHKYVFASSREPSNNEALMELTRLYPKQLRTLKLDVTDESSIVSAAEEFNKYSSPLSMLVNCSGILHEATLQPEKRLRDVKVDQLERIFAVNAYGPLLVAKHFSCFFDKNARTILANISARVASIEDNHLGGWYSYRASKAAQNMFTKNLAIELKRSCEGIICIALHPGTVDTSLSEPFQSNVPLSKLFSAECAAKQLLSVIGELNDDDNGSFVAWDGKKIEW